MEKNMKLMTNIVPLAIFIVGLVVVVTICWVTYDSKEALEQEFPFLLEEVKSE